MTRRGTVLRAAVGASIVTVLAASGYAGATPHRLGMTARQHVLPKLRSGSGDVTTDLRAVAAVPGTSDAYVIEARGLGVDNNKFSVMRLHNGHLTKVWTPKLGGRYGHLDQIAAVSKRIVYVGGAVQLPHSIDDKPAIFRLQGKKFVAMKLPGTASGAVGFSAVSASSPSNVWAMGGIYLATDTGGPQALHFNGKKWAFTATPQSVNFDGQNDASTSGPKNTWATRGDGNLLVWKGSSWTDLGPAPVTNPGPIATSSPHLVYVAGTNAAGKRAIMKFNGKKWLRTTIKGIPSTASIVDLTVAGRQGWAVAQWRSAKNFEVSAILHTSGGAWTKQYVTHGKGLNYIYAISAGSAKHVFAVGTHYPDFDTSGHAITFTLHGRKWKAGK
jgi:hypothetical protein